MIFDNFWPLIFLGLIPIIILLYFLKPKGKDYDISSNLLWKSMLENQQSKTFFEKFTHNILMYLQILIILLLAVALMSPHINSTTQHETRKILVIDTSASMQHTDAKGNTRFAEGINQVISYIKNMDQISLTIITTNGKDTGVLAVDVTDKAMIYDTLRSLSPTDCEGDVTNAQNIIDQLISTDSDPDYTPSVLFLTDGSGAAQINSFHDINLSRAFVIGDSTSNVSNDYMALEKGEDGSYTVLVSITNYSDTSVSFDVSLLDENDRILKLEQQSLAPNENGICIFQNVSVEGNSLHSIISGFQFRNASYDSLAADNKSYALITTASEINGLYVGESNTFLEKSYYAVTGKAITKSNLSLDGNYSFVMYDNHFENDRTINALSFHQEKNASGELKNVMINFSDCDLALGLKDFSIGVNSAYTYTLPDWAKPLLTYEDQIIGYYGEHDDIKEIVVGFDVRESDFPLHGEFPVFIANAINYLNNTSLLSTNLYYAGDSLLVNPWARDGIIIENDTTKAGLYEAINGEVREQYVVRFPSSKESDARFTPVSFDENDTGNARMIKKTLRKFFLILAILLLVIEWIIFVNKMRYKGKFYLFIRGLVFILLLLALIDFRIPLHATKTTTVFVIDLSDSNEENIEEINRYLSNCIHKMPRNNQYGILCFGKNAVVEQFLTSDTDFNSLMSLPSKNATNYEEALQKAVAMIPGGNYGRIVVLTDGKETGGNIQNLQSVFQNKQLELLSYKLPLEEKKDAYISNVTLPSYLHPRDQYTITVVVESNYDTEATLNLYHSSALTASNTVLLTKGTNRFVLNQTVGDESLENILVTIDPIEDECPENNKYNAYSVVEAPPKILVIQGKNASASNFINIMNATGMDYSAVSSHNAPQTIDEMLKFKSIILVDSTYRELPSGFVDNIESYVKDYGCGFVCAGGTHSYAIGGYRETVFEEILPVSMTPKNVNNLPDLAMVMVIDRSGSMSSSLSGLNTASKLDLSIESAKVAVDNLRTKDHVGVLTFDTTCEWQVPIQENSDKDSICQLIEQIPEGGGTSIYPALEEAYSMLKKDSSSMKHIVLLTDGQGETTDYDELIEALNKNNITLSCVAVGSDSDSNLLERLANSCNGRFYYVDESTDLPDIFITEVYLGGSSFIQEGEFPLTVRSSHQLTQGIFTDGWPLLYGYIATSVKDSATALITAGDKQDPILSFWQYGLGRTVAWNSDVSGEWTRGFSSYDDNAQIWKRIMEFSAGNTNMGEDNVSIIQNGDQTLISYKTNEYTKDTKILTTIVNPKGESQEVTLHATAPGKYEANVDTDNYGLYHMNIRKEENGVIQNYMTTATAVQYSDEYKFDIKTTNYDSFIEKYGVTIDENTKVWNKIPLKNVEKRSLMEFLLLTGLLLFLLDIVLRRLQISPKPLSHKKRKKKTPVQNTSGEVLSENLKVDSAPQTTPSSKKEKKKKVKKEEDTLDTSLLLKKKDDRNL